MPCQTQKSPHVRQAGRRLAQTRQRSGFVHMRGPAKTRYTAPSALRPPTMLPLDPDHARHWLSERLARPLAELPGDIPHRHPSHTRPAAVLVPLLWHPGQPTVLLTRREAGLRHHAGQISFPGGKQEADDASACAAALREAHEEIGLAPERVTVVGELPAYVTVTGFCVTPVVGLILPPVRLTAQVGEVAEIFELPLPLALNPANYIRHDYQQEGRRGQYLSLTHGDQFIWGATAAMLRILLAALAE